MTIPGQVIELVERFNRNRDAYYATRAGARSGGASGGGCGRYSETQVRREFIDPPFTCFRWDVDNTAGYAERYKDVIHEGAVRVGGASKAAHCRFRIGTVRRFFSDATEPAQCDVIQRRTDTTDRQIVRLVYELYGLTDDEIRIVEEVTDA